MKDLIVELNQKEKEEIFGGEEKKGYENNDNPNNTDWINNMWLGIPFNFEYQKD
ncbi:hypothetical protein [Bacteroides fluxus]|uniref:Uncharacterized protein n=1 Tax=Bacteroides fluxus YIT 12057 TaxID=763034 RepID=F3PR53_9BACE|nr:hypothetical protein [Bacteroides fluxus]EGF58594.1 hypothetical protein HMPREF9446_01202 [Bacteroides fluxus YIT 12057]MDY3790215.1 hypothetical protein [Bacteroides fluxus]